MLIVYRLSYPSVEVERDIYSNGNVVNSEFLELSMSKQVLGRKMVIYLSMLY